jgi:prepilin peptidase CpaA
MAHRVDPVTEELFLLLVFMPIIFASAASDFQHLKIRNVQILAGLALFVLAAPFLLEMEELSFRILGAATTFAFCFFLFSFRLIGGGDAKMMPVVMLFVPAGEVVLYLRIFAGALLIVSVGSLVLQRNPGLRPAGWTSVHKRRQVPVGVAMATSVAVLAGYLVSMP